MMRRGLAGATFVVFLIVPPTAWGQVKLEFKYPEGNKSTAIKKTKLQQVLTLAGNELKTGSEQTMTTLIENGRRAADGTLPVRHTVSSLVAKVSLPGGIEVNFDSSQEGEPAGAQIQAVHQVLNAISKSSWTATHGPDNQVVKIRGQDKTLDAVDAATRELIKQQFDPEYLKQQSNNQINRVPNTPLQIGDTWERTETLRLEGGQNMTFKTRYEYQGTVNRAGRNLDKIGSQTLTVDYSVDPNAPLRVVNSDLKIAESSGTMFFDRQRGQPAGSQEYLRITGTLTFEVNGMQIPGNLDLKMSQTMVLQQSRAESR